MQGIRYGRSLEKLVSELQLSELTNILKPILDGDAGLTLGGQKKSQFSTALLRAHTAFMNTHWSDAEQVLLQELGFVTWFSESAVHQLIAKFSRFSNSGHVQQSAFLLHFYQAITVRLALASASASLLVRDRLPQVGDQDELVETLIVEYLGEKPTASELSKILGSWDTLYELAGRLLTATDRKPLRVALLDSGSEIVMILVGTALVLGTIRSIYSEVLDRVRFRSNEITERNFQTLREGLRTVKEIETAAEEAGLESDEIRRLEHGVLAEIRGLLGSGVILDRPDRPDLSTDRELARELRGRNLLTEGSSGQTEE